ncbi:duplicated homeodomain-like superfamily protein [Striga asiatica]|uniref:Duplicated homeodomain-like superfamily protein n=1 Tax=Striga asiatica TaxID=4170 RepID=A0A5A7QM60_STRAF|nr:duplicated homeodomain-like superfamily protein [Striga asiatica]
MENGGRNWEERLVKEYFQEAECEQVLQIRTLNPEAEDSPNREGQPDDRPDRRLRPSGVRRFGDGITVGGSTDPIFSAITRQISPRLPRPSRRSLADQKPNTRPEAAFRRVAGRRDCGGRGDSVGGASCKVATTCSSGWLQGLAMPAATSSSTGCAGGGAAVDGSWSCVCVCVFPTV